MAEWKAKRFWKAAAAVEVDGDWTVELDGRAVKTPAKALLRLPTRALAEAVAAEWDAQPEDIDPRTMPFTRTSNSAIDKVAPQFDEVAGIVAAYGETDLCCYRAEGPATLTRLQADAWDPLLAWAGERLGATLRPTVGIVPVMQPEDSLSRLRAHVRARDAFALAALHELVALSGSLLIGLAAAEELLPVEELWQCSRVDETFQESQWGVDEGAAATANRKKEEFLHAAAFYRLSRRGI